MSGDVVIRAEGLGKKYLIGRQAERERYVALRDVLARSARRLARSGRNALTGQGLVAGDTVEEFWALKDISFEVKRGDVVGIIGRNGAGKSTLLKVLSRITEPSEGRVTIKGRIASLLEVGTGFHPELTGRENVYLNGAILGMSRAEIRAKFDEIVAFAEVEKFLDTPVKRYSSGMYVRLAFAVAAHLEPEILVVDEVLAVGDAEFQKKCLGKMQDVAGHGRTVLFVSHNLGAVGALCVKGIFLSHGRMEFAGDVEGAISAYSRPTAAGSAYKRAPQPQAELYIEHGLAEYRLTSDGRRALLALRLAIVASAPVPASVDIRIKDGLGAPIAFGSLGALDPRKLIRFQAGENILEMEIGADLFASGLYRISIDLTDPMIKYYDRAEDCMSFSVEPTVTDGAVRPMQQSWGYGSLQLRIEQTAKEVV